MAPSELPPPPHPISVAPPQSQRVVPVPERSSNATRTGFVKTRPPAARRARKPVIYLYPPSSLPEVTVALSLAFLGGVSPTADCHPVVRRQNRAIPHLSSRCGSQWHARRQEHLRGGFLPILGGDVRCCFLVLTGIDYPSFPPTWFSSANIHLATPNASRATTPIGDVELFDPSSPRARVSQAFSRLAKFLARDV